MARTRTTFFDRVQTFLSQFKQAVLLFLVALMVVLTSSTAYSQDLLQQGQSLYESGQYREAATVLQQAAQQSGNPLRQALALSNLSLAYQALSQWDQAQQAINTSLKLLQSAPPAPHQKAQALEVRGQLALSTGKAQIALEDWRSAAQLFEQNGDRVAASRTRLHQTLALQQLGLYREAFATLQEPPLEFKDKDSTLQVACLRSLSTTIRVVGINLLDKVDQEKQPNLAALGKICAVSDLPDLKDNKSSNYLELAESLLNKAQELTSDRSISAEILLDLGNIKRDAYYRAKDAYERVKIPAQKKEIPELITSTLGFYQQVIDQPISWIHLQARLNQFMFLIEVDRWLSATSETAFVSIAQEVNSRLEIQRPNLSTLLNQLEKLSISYTTFQMRLNLVQSLLPSSTEEEKKVIEILLTRTEAEAQKLGDRVTQSYAMGYLGRLQEQRKYWQRAYKATDRALKLAEDLQQPKLAYEWQWQQGRILAEMKNRPGAIAAYKTALKSLDTVRQDLLGLGNPDLQFSFRDRVEPVYRELVKLLLQSQVENPEMLSEVPKVLETLQVAELENYLRCRLIQRNMTPLQELDDSSVAVVYSVLLDDHVDLMLKFSQQPLKYFRGETVAKETVEKTVDQLKLDIGDSPDAGKLAENQKENSSFHRLYKWLIKPIDQEVQNQRIKTVIFVLDGSFKSIPIAALYDFDAKQYAVEKPYSIALNLGLQLPKSRTIDLKSSSILIAGLSESVQLKRQSGKLDQTLKALKFVKDEVNAIQSFIPILRQQILLNSDFTVDNFKRQLVKTSASIVHVATHGQFNSSPDETYLVASDDSINLSLLAQLFQARSASQPSLVELLVLSACRTAQGDRRALLGMAGMAYQTGANSTIASLKLINDPSTAELMKLFYSALQKPSMTRAEALHFAQLKLKKKYKKPFYWGTFVLLGNWN